MQECHAMTSEWSHSVQAVNNVSQEDCNDFQDDFGASSNTICLVDNMDAFLSETNNHPLVTIAPIKTCLNLENVCSLKFEVDTGASHNIISKRCFDQIQNSLIRQGK